jgi:hypothetical protein
MKIDAALLANNINTGLSLIAGEKDASTYMYIQDEKLYTVFEAPNILYGSRLEVADVSNFTDCCIDAIMLSKLITQRKGDLNINMKGNKLTISSKEFRVEMQTLEKEIPSDLMARVFSKPNVKAVDVSELSRLPSAFKKVFLSIRDNVNKEELSVRCRLSGSTMTILIADSFHGAILESPVSEAVKNTVELILPLSIFLRIINLESSKTFIEETTFTTRNRNQFLTGTLKATSNSSITIEMMDNVLKKKSKDTISGVPKDALNEAISRCRSMSDQYPLSLTNEKGRLSLSIRSDGGQVSERIDVDSISSTKLDAQCNLVNMRDIVTCCGPKIDIGIQETMMVFNSTISTAKIRGGCVLSQQD